MRIPDELRHYGVLGMKWGIRRYQPYYIRGRKSGKTGREIGEAGRLDRDSIKRKIKKANEKSIKTKTEPISPTQATLRESKNITDHASNIARKRKTKKQDTSSMSDKELRDAINRLQMEQQYDRLVSEKEYERSGREKVVNMLETAGDVLAIGVSAATIVSIMSDLNKK